MRKKKCLLCCSYNPNKALITKNLVKFHRNQDLFLSKYDNFTLLGDFNSEPCEQPMTDFCHDYNFQNIIKDKICFKNLHNPLHIDLFIKKQTNKLSKFYDDRNRFV